VLGSGAAAAAPGHDLTVGRVTIAPGATIPPHVHPGTQVATIVSGELTYTVLSGEIPVTLAGGGSPGATRTVRAGETVVLRAGRCALPRGVRLHNGLVVVSRRFTIPGRSTRQGWGTNARLNLPGRTDPRPEAM
jgi:hypothetical protein